MTSVKVPVHTPHPTRMPQAVDDDSYEDLLSLWSDLESGMGILLGHPASPGGAPIHQQPTAKV